MAQDVNVHLGRRVRHRRWMIGMTQRELADGLGVRFQQVQKYESGANRISADRLWHMSHILNVPIAYFYDGLPDPMAPILTRQLGEAELTDAVMIIEHYGNISPAERGKLKALAQNAGPSSVTVPQEE